MKQFMPKSLMGQKLKQDDDVTDQNVNQSRTTENEMCTKLEFKKKLLVVRHKRSHPCDAEACVGTVGRAFTANNMSNAERSKWTRS